MDNHCYVEPIYKELTPADQLQKADKASLIVWSMGCPNCATRVRNSLLAVDGVYGLDVYLNMAVAQVSYDSQTTMPTEFAAAVAKGKRCSLRVPRTTGRDGVNRVCLGSR